MVTICEKNRATHRQVNVDGWCCRPFFSHGLAGLHGDELATVVDDLVTPVGRYEQLDSALGVRDLVVTPLTESIRSSQGRVPDVRLF